MNELRLTLLRHGRSRADDENVHEGRYDSPLTETGLRQARALAAYWAAHPPGCTRLVCSTLARARQTAELVGAALHLTPEPSDLWMEWDNGPLAGLAEEEAERLYPTPAFRHNLDPYTRDGGESVAAMRARLLFALEDIWTCGHDHVLVVAHGGVLGMALRELLDMRHGWCAFGDTAYATVQLDRHSHTAWLTGVNLRPHLS